MPIAELHFLGAWQLVSLPDNLLFQYTANSFFMPDISADETFELIIRHQTTQELMPFLLGLDKKEIILVRLKTKALYRKMNDWRSDNADKLRRNKEALLFLAGLATYSRQEAMGRTFELPSSFFDTNPKDNRGHSALFIAILRHTRPNWLTDWLIQITRTMGWDALDYLLLRELADEGIVTYDPWLFSQSLSSGFRYNHAPNTPLDGTFGTRLLANLQADKILLERDLPLLFDFDTKADWHRFFGGKNSELITWTTVMVQLAESGHLDRNDLLTRSLLALRRDFRRPLLTWFKEVFAALSPTLAERLARQSELLELLAHPLPLVINFALEQLQDLWPEPTFNPASVLHYADGLMTRPDLKTGVRALLGTFEKLLKRTPTLVPTLPPILARLATTALANADATVQARAAKLLLAITRAKKPLLSIDEMGETTAAIAQYAGLLTTEARSLLAPFLPVDLAPEPGADPAAAYVPRTEFVPDLSPATAIAPVADWHELLFLTGQVLQQDNPANLERWVDGLLRLRRQVPDGYAQQLRPYLLQAMPEKFEDRTAEETAKQLQTHVFDARSNGHLQFMQALLISWFGAFESPRLSQISLIPGQHNTPDPLLRVELQRLAAAEARLHPCRAVAHAQHAQPCAVLGCTLRTGNQSTGLRSSGPTSRFGRPRRSTGPHGFSRRHRCR